MNQESNQVTLSVSLDLAMAESWLKLSSHYRTAREKQGILWNRTNSLDILNFFIDQHGRLIESFGYDYLQLEKSMVTQAAKQFEAKLPFDPVPEHEIQTTNSDTQRNLACWHVALATYCRIHGRLKIELRAWNQSDYDEFESAIHRLCEEVR